MVTRGPDFEATITFLTTEEGGRSTPVYSGYRPNQHLGLSNILSDAVHYYDTDEAIYPGQTVKAQLTLFYPFPYHGALSEGLQFTVQEGSRIVGRGMITKICNPQFQSRPGDPRPAES